MTITRSLLTKLFVLLFAGGAAMGAMAQGPRGHVGPGGPGGGAAPLAMLLLDTEVHAALGLTAEQQVLWTALQTAADSAHAQHETARSTLQALVTSQFASGAPDLVAIDDAVVAQHQTMADAAEIISTQAVVLFSRLDAGQQAIVVIAAQARYAQARQR